MSFCSQCGNPIDAGTRFCSNCGHELEAESSSAPRVGSPQAAPVPSQPAADTPPASPPPDPQQPAGKESLGAVGWMRKLGIMRAGTYSGTYSSAKDMPSEMLMDDVYDAKKDLVHRSDFQSATAPPAEIPPGADAPVVPATSASPQVTGAKGGIRIGRIVYFAIMTLLAGFWLITCVATTSSIPAILLQFALWIGLAIVAGIFSFAGRLNGWIMAGLTVAVFLFSFILMSLTVD